MCKCTPEVRTPFCGRPGCQWPDNAPGMKVRPTVDEYFLKMAHLAAERATCARRRVGCVLVNERHHVLATGYNGVASGLPHCTDQPCAGAGLPSGTGLETCEAIHAEQNALLQCRDVFEIDTCYCTTAPCVTCTKLLMNTGCRRIVFAEGYPQASSAAALWRRKDGRLWQIIMLDGVVADARYAGPIDDNSPLRRHAHPFRIQDFPDRY